MKITNPKRRRANRGSAEYWYGYHAGYSSVFVENALSALCLEKNAVTLDPWNGTGVTTFVAEKLGFRACGFDINPAMVVVAKSRCLSRSVLPSIKSLSDEIIENSRSLSRQGLKLDPEPFAVWLDQKAAACLRAIEKSVYNLLINRHNYEPLFFSSSLAHVSSLAAFFYLALFKTLRYFLSPYTSSNPTWLKAPGASSPRLHISECLIVSRFRYEVENLGDLFVSIPGSPEDSMSTGELEVASSDSLPLPEKSVDAVVSSPPYCTRIDYAIATWPELAVLGCPARSSLKDLRNRMIGTPTIDKHREIVSPRWGVTCLDFLDSVASHDSYAAQSYYMPYYKQYFSAIFASLLELDRVLAPSAPCILVVQDSYFKNIKNDLPKIFVEMAANLDWSVEAREDFPVLNNLAAINRSSKAYRPKTSATETVLAFRRKSCHREI